MGINHTLLKSFWTAFGKSGHKTYKSMRSKERTLEALRSVTDVVSLHSVGLESNRRIRDKFNKVKYKRHSLVSHRMCFACGDEAQVRHHIIPLKNGGRNSKRNLVSLCDECHSFIHPWMR